MSVSVIIPTYNRAYILADAIRSVLGQSYMDFELIIVDDGSTDNTLEIVQRFSDPRIRLLVRQENGGVAAALNTGLHVARGAFIALLGSDDTWRSDKLEIQVSSLRDHPQAAGAFSDVSRIVGNEETPSLLRAYHPAFMRMLEMRGLEDGGVVPQRDLYLCLLQEMPVKIQATLLRSSAVRATGLFDEAWHSGEDWEFILRFAKAHAMVYHNHSLTAMRTLPDSTLSRWKKEDAANLMNHFSRERISLRGDDAATAAIRRGIATQSRELGYQHLHEHQNYKAFRAYSRGFAESHDLSLLVRAFAAVFPPQVWTSARRLLANRML